MFTLSGERRRFLMVGLNATVATAFKTALQGHKIVWDEVDPTHAKWSADTQVVFVQVDDAADLSVIERLARSREKGQRLIAVGDVHDPAIMRKLIRLGIADLLTNSASPEEIVEATKYEARVPAEGPERIFAFTPVLGGMGATTLAIETALIVSNGGKRSTCVIDLDFYAGECADYLNVEPKLSLDALASPPDAIDNHFIDAVLTEHSSGLKLLAAQTQLGSQKHVNAKTVIHILNVISARFENVMIDLPRAWYEWTDDVLLGADRLFLISDGSVPAIRAAKRQLLEYGQRYAGKVVPLIIVNKQARGLFAASLSDKDLASSFGDQFAGSIIDDTAIAREAINRGVPISAVNSRARLISDLGRIMNGLQAGKR